MKSVCLVLIVLMAYEIYGEGLKCNRCVPPSPGSRCINTVETCDRDVDGCARVIFKPPITPSYFKSCMKRSKCQLLGLNPSIDAYCCTNNLCN